MSEFKVNTITNRDGSYGFHRYVVSLPLEVLVCNYQVDQQSFVVEEEEEYLEVVQLHLLHGKCNIDVIEIATTGNAVDFGDDKSEKKVRLLCMCKFNSWIICWWFNSN